MMNVEHSPTLTLTILLLFWAVDLNAATSRETTHSASSTNSVGARQRRRDTKRRDEPGPNGGATGNELYELRIYEGAPPGTKATPNEALDRLLRREKNCFAQLEVPPNSVDELDWLEFDPALLIFVTTGDAPLHGGHGQQQQQGGKKAPGHHQLRHTILHLMCSSNQMRSISLAVHVTRRNRHPPKFSAAHYEFYAPADLRPGLEIGRLHVTDSDPIIYNSQVQLSVLPPSSLGTASPQHPQHHHRHSNGIGRAGQQSQQHSDEEAVVHWEVFKNGSLNVRRLMTDLQLYRPYHLRVLAADFGSPQLITIANVTIVPVSVSPPLNVRVNVANQKYQIFEWDPPSYGVAERFRINIRRRRRPNGGVGGGNAIDSSSQLLYTQEVDGGENMAMSRMHFPKNMIANPNSEEFEVTIVAVDVDGETPSQPHTFMLITGELTCEGECSPRGGTPMCHYGRLHRMEQYRDASGPHCLCFDGFSSPQCDIIESCPSERTLEVYGGIDWPHTPVNRSATTPCPYNSNGETLERRCYWEGVAEAARWENVSKNDVCKTQSSTLVHLGLFANYAQKPDQTASGLMAAQRFIESVLLFPSFQPNVSTAHFDSKIAEHAAQIIDIIASRNLSLVAGNASEVRTHLIAYMGDFARRMPVPYMLESGGGGLQLKTWYWLPSHGTPPPAVVRNEDYNDEEVEEDGEERGEEVTAMMIGGPAPAPPASFPTQLAQRCYIHLPGSFNSGHSGPSSSENSEESQRGSRGRGTAALRLSSQLLSSHRPRIVRALCLANTTLYPGLHTGTPLLVVNFDELDESGDSPTASTSGDGHWQRLPHGLKALVGLRPGDAAMRENYTCAYYDPGTGTWRREGMRLVSRNFDQHGYLLCETTHLSVFALLPESMFEPPSSLVEILTTAVPLVSGAIAVLATLFLLLAASAASSSARGRGRGGADPALLLLLLTTLLLHSIHVVLLLLPEFAPNVAHTAEVQLYLLQQYAALSLTALFALINFSLYERAIDVEAELVEAGGGVVGPKRSGWCRRFFGVVLWAILLPVAMCAITWLRNAYIYSGAIGGEIELRPFNWAFGLSYLLPLIAFLSLALIYALCVVSNCRSMEKSLSASGNSSVNFVNGSSNHNNNSGGSLISPRSSPVALEMAGKRKRLLGDLGSAAGLSLLVMLILSLLTSAIYAVGGSLLRSLMIGSLHLGVSFSLFVFVGMLYRLEVRRQLPAAESFRHDTGGRPRSSVEAHVNGYRKSLQTGEVEATLQLQPPPGALFSARGAKHCNGHKQWAASNGSNGGGRLSARQAYTASSAMAMQSARLSVAESLTTASSGDSATGNGTAQRRNTTGLVKSAPSPSGYRTSAVLRQDRNDYLYGSVGSCRSPPPPPPRHTPTPAPSLMKSFHSPTEHTPNDSSTRPIGWTFKQCDDELGMEESGEASFVEDSNVRRSLLAMESEIGAAGEGEESNRSTLSHPFVSVV